MTVLLTRLFLLACPIDPVFRADSVVLAISAEKDGNLRVVYGRIGRCQGRPAWRGACAAVPRRYVLHQVKRGAPITSAPSVTRHARPSPRPGRPGQDRSR